MLVKASSSKFAAKTGRHLCDPAEVLAVRLNGLGGARFDALGLLDVEGLDVLAGLGQKEKPLRVPKDPGGFVIAGLATKDR
jgi:hypothetical protein